MKITRMFLMQVLILENKETFNIVIGFLGNSTVLTRLQNTRETFSIP